MTDFCDPHDAVVLLTRALDYVDCVEPAAARDPIRDLLRGAVETCSVSHTLVGKPVTFALQIAQALVDEAEARGCG